MVRESLQWSERSRKIRPANESNDFNDEVHNKEDANGRAIEFWTSKGGLVLGLLEDRTGSAVV